MPVVTRGPPTPLATGQERPHVLKTSSSKKNLVAKLRRNHQSATPSCLWKFVQILELITTIIGKLHNDLGWFGNLGRGKDPQTPYNVAPFHYEMKGGELASERFRWWSAQTWLCGKINMNEFCFSACCFFNFTCLVEKDALCECSRVVEEVDPS